MVSHVQQRIQAHLDQRDKALSQPIVANSNNAGLDDAVLSVNDEGPYKGMDISILGQDIKILSSDIKGITQGILNSRWTATEVLHAYIRSARRAQLRTNCITEVCFEHAYSLVAHLDRHFEQTGKLVGPLHGVPISIKDMLKVQGSQMTLGFSSWLEKPKDTESSSVVIVIEHLGGVPFVKTNVPQTMLAFECRNPMFGTTTNPFSPDHTPGGSSGGEVAIVGCDGAAAGVGTDIGGSIRIPSGYSGLYAIKPSPHTWSLNGKAEYGNGLDTILTVAGPMCRTAEDVETFFTSVVKATLPPLLLGDQVGDDDAKAAAEYDARLAKFQLTQAPKICFNEAWLDPLKVIEQRATPLQIGYAYHEGLVKTSPACYRAIKECVAALQAKYPSRQVELVHINPAELRGAEAIRLFIGLTSSDGYNSLTNPHLGSDKLDSSLMTPVYGSRLPGFLKSLLALIARYGFGDEKYANIIKELRTKSASEFFQLVARKARFRKEWSQKIWEGYELDALLTPVQASPALPHHGADSCALLAVSTIIYNILDSSVAVLPVTRVDARIDSHREEDFANAEDKKYFDEWSSDPDMQDTSPVINYSLYNLGNYDAKKMHGLPIGVQVVTKPWEETKAIGIMRLLDDALPQVETRGGKWNNQLDIEGKRLDESDIKSAQGFGPGSVTRALFQK